jgi:lipopolysaccharide/colanic/teichoic acid biosynthesis glycosyltransferase
MPFSFFKRTLDLVISFIGLIFFGPIILLVGMFIKFNSPGPVFYKQERVGKNSKTFLMYKLRTMIKDAEAKTGPVWAKRNDSRITGMGYFLRRSHIDELPQLFNVLKGEMSLVGPRPERPEIIEKFNHLIPNYEKKLSIKPGITGYAQIRHKYDETLRDVKTKLKYELFYIQRMCLMLDLKILLVTILVLVIGKDDYIKI